MAAAAASHRNRTGEFSLPLDGNLQAFNAGFQPLGIQDLGSQIAIADYFAPAVILARITIESDVLHFRDIRWIEGTIFEGVSVRMFPDVLMPSGANRMQTALLSSNMEVGLVRNGERKIFWIELAEGDKWHHLMLMELPGSGYDMINSAKLLSRGRFLTIESRSAFAEWAVCRYEDLKFVDSKPIAPYRYGVTVRKSDGAIFTIADPRADEKGLFVNDELLIPDITGNGIALLDDGRDGALVTHFGQALPGPFKGQPGSMTYIPAHLLT